jgi:hypothetical protein
MIMEFVFLPGTEETAPTCIAAAGLAPVWNGKSRSELTRSDMDDMLVFCMKEVRQIGHDDYRFGRPVRVNPFHRRYLHGMPHLYFKAFYQIGRKDAADQMSKQPALLAA